MGLQQSYESYGQTCHEAALNLIHVLHYHGSNFKVYRKVNNQRCWEYWVSTDTEKFPIYFHCKNERWKAVVNI